MFADGYTDFKAYIIKYGKPMAREILKDYIHTIDKHLGKMSEQDREDEQTYIAGAKAALA